MWFKFSLFFFSLSLSLSLSLSVVVVVDVVVVDDNDNNVNDDDNNNDDADDDDYDDADGGSSGGDSDGGDSDGGGGGGGGDIVPCVKPFCCGPVFYSFKYNNFYLANFIFCSLFHTAAVFFVLVLVNVFFMVQLSIIFSRYPLIYLHFFSVLYIFYRCS